VPFLHSVQLISYSTAQIRAKAQVDDAAMCNCLSFSFYKKHKNILGPLQQSNILLQFANGHCMRTIGSWTGSLSIQNYILPITLEVFDNGDAFELILGKNWLTSVKATHFYSTDTLAIPTSSDPLIVCN
ncbi:hypothetical protein SCHPADRAFT_807799, partial [Schizopora paradoxa]